MKAKNSFTRTHAGQKAIGNMTGKRSHAAPKAAAGASGESGDAISGRRKAFLLRRTDLSSSN